MDKPKPPGPPAKEPKKFQPGEVPKREDPKIVGEVINAAIQTAQGEVRGLTEYPPPQTQVIQGQSFALVGIKRNVSNGEIFAEYKPSQIQTGPAGPGMPPPPKNVRK